MSRPSGTVEIFGSNVLGWINNMFKLDEYNYRSKKSTLIIYFFIGVIFFGMANAIPEEQYKLSNLSDAIGMLDGNVVLLRQILKFTGFILFMGAGWNLILFYGLRGNLTNDSSDLIRKGEEPSEILLAKEGLESARDLETLKVWRKEAINDIAKKDKGQKKEKDISFVSREVEHMSQNMKDSSILMDMILKQMKSDIKK